MAETVYADDYEYITGQSKPAEDKAVEVIATVATKVVEADKKAK